MIAFVKRLVLICTLLELEQFYFFICYYICYSVYSVPVVVRQLHFVGLANCWTGKLILSIRGVPSFTAQVLLVDHVCIAKLCIVACWHHVQSRGGKK